MTNCTFITSYLHQYRNNGEIEQESGDEFDNLVFPDEDNWTGNNGQQIFTNLLSYDRNHELKI